MPRAAAITPRTPPRGRALSRTDTACHERVAAAYKEMYAWAEERAFRDVLKMGDRQNASSGARGTQG